MKRVCSILLAASMLALCLCSCGAAPESVQSSAALSSSSDDLAAMKSELDSLRAENESLKSELAALQEGSSTPEISTPSASPTDEVQAPANSEYGRTNPAPIGVTQTVTIEDFVVGTYTLAVTVNELISGDAAYDALLIANQFNDPPEDGMMYVLANITMELTECSSDKCVSVSQFDFDSFSGNGVQYDFVSAVTPDPSLFGDLYVGGSLTGYTVFMVSADDKSPTIVLGRNYDGSGGIWFSLLPSESSASAEDSGSSAVEPALAPAVVAPEAEPVIHNPHETDPLNWDDVDIFLMSVGSVLSEYVGNCHTEIAVDNEISVSIWEPGIEFSGLMSSVGYMENYTEQWNTFTDMLFTLDEAFRIFMQENGLNGYTLTCSIVSDKDQETILYSVSDGEQVYCLFDQE